MDTLQNAGHNSISSHSERSEESIYYKWIIESPHFVSPRVETPIIWGRMNFVETLHVGDPAEWGKSKYMDTRLRGYDKMDCFSR